MTRVPLQVTPCLSDLADSYAGCFSWCNPQRIYLCQKVERISKNYKQAFTERCAPFSSFVFVFRNALATCGISHFSPSYYCDSFQQVRLPRLLHRSDAISQKDNEGIAKGNKYPLVFHDLFQDNRSHAGMEFTFSILYFTRTHSPAQKP